MTEPTAALDATLVIPTVGRPSLQEVLDDLARCDGPLPAAVVLADDRTRDDGAVADVPRRLRDLTEVVRVGGRGPAAARNAGWRRATTTWVAFLDDDVRPPADWLRALGRDLQGQPADVAASQGRIEVPLPVERAPTDWERNVAGLEHARWATADMAYRREALAAVGGFDERFGRAYREDADLGLRTIDAGWRIVTGERRMVHPVRPADDWVSLRMQAGNAEDPFMRALHGPGWRTRAGVPTGRRPLHLATVVAALLGLGALVTRRHRAATAGLAITLGLVADFAWRRIAPGPRDPDEVRRMLVTSVLLPFAATWHWVRGVLSVSRRLRAPSTTPAAVLFDRDGTLVVDVPYNGEPSRVAPVPGATRAVRRLRRHGVLTGVVTNQSGVARGLLTEDQVTAVNRRVDELFGGLGPWLVCPHGPDDGCTCRKPAPQLIREAAHRLGVDPRECVVIGDTGADVDAALAAGARGILVPNGVTRTEEVRAAPEVARDIAEAVDLALRPRPRTVPA